MRIYDFSCRTNDILLFMDYIQLKLRDRLLHAPSWKGKPFRGCKTVQLIKGAELPAVQKLYDSQSVVKVEHIIPPDVRTVST